MGAQPTSCRLWWRSSWHDRRERGGVADPATRRQNTINPPGGEADAIEIVGALLEDAGFTTRLVELAPGRPNLIARIAGSDAEAPALGFTGHLDVVPLGEAPWAVDPFAGEADGDRLFGRGTSDMKAGVAAMVLAACRVARSPAAAPASSWS